MESIAKFLHPSSRLILLTAVFLVVLLAVSVWGVNRIPVFGDEAIYVRWAQIIKNVETLRFIPLTDGKQPLFMWLNAATLKFFTDPLLAGRFVSITAGLLTLATASYFAFLFFPKVYPLVLVIFSFNFYLYFYQRLALADALLTSFGLLSLLLAYLLSRYPRLDISLISGVVLGLSWITKSPAIYFFVLFFVTFALLAPNSRRRLSVFVYPIISLFIGFIIYNLLRLGPQFHQIALRNLDYLWPVAEIIRHPLDPFWPHLKAIMGLYWFYLGPLVLALVLIPWVKLPKTVWVLFLWWLLPTIGNLLLARVLTARYLLYTLPPLLLILAYLLSRLRYGFILALILLLPSIFKIISLNHNPFNFNLPVQDAGYLTDWTSGWGIQDSAAYLIDRSQAANVIVGTEGYFGTLPQGLEIYTDSRPQLTVIGVGLGFDQIPPGLVSALNAGDEVYLLINRSRNRLDSSVRHQLRLVKSYPKPGGDFLDLFLLVR